MLQQCLDPGAERGIGGAGAGELLGPVLRLALEGNVEHVFDALPAVGVGVCGPGQNQPLTKAARKGPSFALDLTAAERGCRPHLPCK